MPEQATLLLPGLMLDGRVFAGQMHAVQAFGPVLIGNIARDATIAAIADRLLGELPPHFAVAGLSMGGIVAFELWRRAPERITHLALIDTSPHAESAERRRQRDAEIASAEAGGLRDLLAESMKPRYLARCSRERSDLRQSILDMGLSMGLDAFRNQALALRDRPDSRATLPHIACPTLVLAGREDELCPWDWQVEMAARIPGSELQILAGCGHLAPMEDPEAVSHALTRLLRRSHEAVI